ncbi:flagellar motor protein MotB [Actinomycetaceae bacterium L2_0104]
MSRAPAKRRRRRPVAAEQHASEERWAISYMDMVTVMMCLFIVLFAISQVDQQKFEQLSKSLGAAFGGDASQLQILDGNPGILDGQEGTQSESEPLSVEQMLAASQMPGDDAAQIAREEIANMQDLKEQLQSDLEALDLADEVSFRYTDRGLVVGLVTENVFFQPSQADLSETTVRVLDTIAPRIRDLPNEIAVEGHANVLPPNASYETNWELSVDRATKVTRHFTERGGIPGNRILATGFGDTRPLVTGKDPESLAMNRRVDIVVVTTATGEARDQLGQMVEQLEGGE